MAEIDSFVMTNDPTWRLEVDGYDPKLEPTIEAVLSLINGYSGTRAATEEGTDVSRPATFLAGVFNTPQKPQAPELQDPISEIVVAPHWSKISVTANGQELRIGHVELLSQRRVLDLRQGVLLREWRVRDGMGWITTLRSLRFASLHDRHLLVQLLTITPENYDGQITLEAVLDGRVTNENNTQHLEQLGGQARERGALLLTKTIQSGYELAFVADATLHNTDDTADIEGEAIIEEGRVGQLWTWQAERGKIYELRKVVAVATSRDAGSSLALATERLDAAADAGGAAVLLAAHTAAWDARWLTCDAVIAGDEELQRQARWAMYQLAGAAHAGDERASIGARSLTGERYRGHVFWDTETFVWPFFLFTEPATARALLLYRYHTLGGARNKARSMGYKGALYAWESTDTGEETTPPFVNVPGVGEQAILTGVQEHHLAADIAYAVVQYRTVTGDEQFFLRYGAEMLLEIARFWSTRAVLGDDGAYHINTVIGPDEYHEHVNDNAFTNVMAQWTLWRGLQAARELQTQHPDRWHQLSAQLALNDDELSAWRRVADGLTVLYNDETKLFEQFAGYFGLAEVDLSDHDMAVQTLDVKLGWANLQKTKALKQADVVMLTFLLWDELPPGTHEANFRYYEPRTTHDSSLSPSFHALLAARLNDLPMADDYLRRAARIDLDFTRKGWAGATGGVHIAALGGIWQALAFGFLGIRPQNEGLRFDPHIPPAWGSLQMPLQWRGRRLRATAHTDGRTEIALEHGEPLRVALGEGAWQELTVGETIASLIDL